MRYSGCRKQETGEQEAGNSHLYIHSTVEQWPLLPTDIPYVTPVPMLRELSTESTSTVAWRDCL
jgi:hypothetical protein